MPDHHDLPDFAPDDSFITAVRRRVAARRRRNRRVLASSTLAVALLAGTGVWYADHRLSSIQRIDLDPAVTAPDSSDPLTTGAPFNLLVLGFDGCPLGAPTEECDATRPQPGQADSIVVIHVDPTKRTLDVLNVYRDLSFDGKRKLSALTTPELITTLRTQLGIGIDHFVGLGLGGFRDLGELLQLRLDMGASVRDRMTGLDLAAGCQVISGSQLLALTRARHLEVQQADGSWTPEASGDFGRVHRQQTLLIHVMLQLPDLGLGNATKLDALARQLERSAIVDDGLDNSELLDLAHLLTTLEMTTVVDLPTTNIELANSSSGLAVGDPAEASSVVAPFGGHFDGPSPSGPATTDPSGTGDPATAGWSNFRAC